jgi:PhnB protein
VHSGSSCCAFGGALQPIRKVPMSVSFVPEGFHTITPNIIVDDAKKAIAFLAAALGAEEIVKLTLPDGKIVHCELQIGDSRLNLGESMEGWPAHGLVAQLYVANSDELFARAVAAGAQVVMPMTDMFFGTREGRVSDPFGNIWTIATRKERVSYEEMQRRINEQMPG